MTYKTLRNHPKRLCVSLALLSLLFVSGTRAVAVDAQLKSSSGTQQSYTAEVPIDEVDGGTEECEGDECTNTIEVNVNVSGVGGCNCQQLSSEDEKMMEFLVNKVESLT